MGGLGGGKSQSLERQGARFGKTGCPNHETPSTGNVVGRVEKKEEGQRELAALKSTMKIFFANASWGACLYVYTTLMAAHSAAHILSRN